MSESKRRSPCPIACTLDLIGDRWTLLVIRDLFAGRSHFGEFAASPERISSNILADRLTRLERSGLIKRLPSPIRSDQHCYTLTDKGTSLAPILQSMTAWGLKHVKGTEARIAVRVPGERPKPRS